MLSYDDFVSEGTGGSEADRRLPVRFSVEAKLDGVATADKEKNPEGRLIYRDREYITILIPGDKTLDIHRPVIPADKQRFSTQYAAWKLQRQTSSEASVQGTPLAGWPGCTDAQRKELAYFNCFTVEQLADLSDGFASNMMGIQQMKATAKRYVAASKSNAPLLALEAKIQERDALIAGLQEQINQIAAGQVKPVKQPKTSTGE